MNITQARKRLKKLGYGLSRDQRDALGRSWKYRTSPISGNGGPTNYFNTLKEVELYIKQVEQIRGFQEN